MGDTEFSASNNDEKEQQQPQKTTELIRKLELNQDEIKLLGYLSLLEPTSPVYKEIFYHIKDNEFFSESNKDHLDQVFKSLQEKGLIQIKDIPKNDGTTAEFVLLIKGPHIVDLIIELRELSLGLIDHERTYRDLALLYLNYDYPFSPHALGLLNQIGFDYLTTRLKLTAKEKRKLIYVTLRDDDGETIDTSVMSYLIREAMGTYNGAEDELDDDLMGCYFFRLLAILSIQSSSKLPNSSTIIMENFNMALNVGYRYAQRHQVPTPVLVGAILSDVGQFYRSQNHVKESIPYLEKSLEIYKSSENPNQGLQTVMRLADSYLSTDQYQLAANMYEMALDQPVNGIKIKDQKDSQLKPTILQGLADCYLHLNRFDESIELSKEALRLEKDNPDQVFRHTNQIALAYNWSERYTESIEYYIKISEMPQAQKSSLFGVIMGTLALCYEKTDQYQKALSTFIKAQEINKGLGIDIGFDKKIVELKKKVGSQNQMSLVSLVNRNRSFFFWGSAVSVIFIGLFKYLKINK
eukprot:gene2698-3349_t